MNQPPRGTIQSLNGVLDRMGSSDEVVVLQVDDQSDLCYLIRDFVESERDHLSIRSETDPNTALDRVQSEDDRFDCIVSDYDMPGLDGLEFLEAVRSDDPDIPFILFTGKGSEEIASEAISVGVTDYIQKGGGRETFEMLANRIENAAAHYLAEKETQRVLQTIERAREGISLIDAEGQFFYLNHAYAEIVGYPRDQLIGEHWDVLYPDGAADDMKDNILPHVSAVGRWEGYSTFEQQGGASIVVDHGLSYTTEGDLVCTIQPAQK